MVEQIRQRKALLWQQAETIFRQANRDVRRAVLDRRYDDARRALAHARQTIDANRNRAMPSTAYGDLVREAGAMARFIDEDERKVERARLPQAMAEIAEHQRTRRESARALADVRADTTARDRPAMRYPDDRPAKTIRRARPASTAPRAPSTGDGLRQRLQRQIAEVAFVETPLGEVVERLNRQEGLNIDVRWRVLAQVDIDRETPVTAERLTRVRLSTALRAILASIAGEPGQVGFMVDGELLVLSTMDDLRRSLELRVYDVRDLLHDTPDFYQTSGGGLGGYGRGSGGYGSQGGGYGGYGGRATGRGS